MHLDYHIPIPKFEPTPGETAWVMKYIVPQLTPALEIMKGAFERVDIDQKYFEGWPQRKAVEEHFKELGLKIRRFAGFISQPNQDPKIAHIDGHYRGVPLVARFNITYQGKSPVTLDWWNETVDGGKIVEREFTELRNGVETKAYSFKSASSDEWLNPDYTVNDPGPCWNRTELAHRVSSPHCDVSRISITAEIDGRIAWPDLVARLSACGYC